MLGSGGVDRLGLDITIMEFRVSTNTFMLLLRDAIVRPSLNSAISSGVRIIIASVCVLLSSVWTLLDSVFIFMLLSFFPVSIFSKWKAIINSEMLVSQSLLKAKSLVRSILLTCWDDGPGFVRLSVGFSSALFRALVRHVLPCLRSKQVIQIE